MRILLIACMAAGLISCTAPREPVQAKLEFPPLKPEKTEVNAMGDPDFMAGCHEHVSYFTKRFVVNFQRDPVTSEALITHSEKFGTILRMDVTHPDDPAGAAVNRLVCWRKSSGQVGLLIGIQRLDPLH